MKPKELQIRAAFATLEALEQCEGRGRNDRLSLLETEKQNPVLRQLFELTYDWRRSFNVILPEHSSHATEFSLAKNARRFRELVKIISRQAVPPWNTRQLADQFFTGCTPLEAKWYRRVLERDLRVGVNQKLLRQVWPELAVDFVPPASETLNDTRRLRFPLTISPTTPGLPVWIVVYRGGATAFSDGQRPLPILSDFGKRLARVCRSGIFSGSLSIKGFTSQEVESLFRSHAKSIPLDAFRLIYGNMRVELRDFFSLSLFDPASSYRDPTPFRLRRRRLARIYRRLAGSKRTITLPRQTRVHSQAALPSGIEMLQRKNPSGREIEFRQLNQPAIGREPVAWIQNIGGKNADAIPNHPAQ